MYLDEQDSQLTPCAVTGENHSVTLPRESGLLAVLLNPPACSSGVRTRNAVARAATVLGYDSVRLVNLCTIPTPSVVELNEVSEDGWALAREELGAAALTSSAILAGWGVGGILGNARYAFFRQLNWFVTQAQKAGHRQLWTVGGEPRHPSRWHQYVSDKYARTSGGSFEHRLRQVLIAMPIEQASPTARSPASRLRGSASSRSAPTRAP